MPLKKILDGIGNVQDGKIENGHPADRFAGMWKMNLWRGSIIP